MLYYFSTPDLDVVEGHQQTFLQKAPPPYPINRPSSNSTPDLASQALCAPRPHLFSPQVSNEQCITEMHVSPLTISLFLEAVCHACPSLVNVC